VSQVSLIIGTDICPTENNFHLFENGNAKSLIGIDISKRFYSRKKLLKLQNYIQCEAHRELLLKGLK